MQLSKELQQSNKALNRTDKPLTSMAALTYITNHYFDQSAHWVSSPLARRYA